MCGGGAPGEAGSCRHGSRSPSTGLGAGGELGWRGPSETGQIKCRGVSRIPSREAAQGPEWADNKQLAEAGSIWQAGKGNRKEWTEQTRMTATRYAGQELDGGRNVEQSRKTRGHPLTAGGDSDGLHTRGQCGPRRGRARLPLDLHCQERW